MGLLDWFFNPITQAGSQTMQKVITPAPGTPASNVAPSPSFTPVVQTQPATYQPTNTQSGYDQAAGVMSPVTKDIYSGASSISETIRRGIPEVSRRISAVPVIGSPLAFVTSRTSESTARIIETGGMVPGGVEVLVRRPQVFPAAVSYGVGETIRSVREEMETNPSQIVSDFAITGLMFKGLGRVPIKRTFSTPNIKAFIQSERAQVFPKNRPSYYFGEGSGLKRLSEPKALPKLKIAVMEREPVVLPSLKGLTVAPPKTITEMKILAQPKILTETKILTMPKTIEETRIWTRTKPDILTKTRTKTRTLIVPFTAIKTQTATRIQVFPKTQIRTITRPQVMTQTRLKVQPLTRTATQLQVKPMTQVKLQTRLKVKPLVQTKTMTRTRTALKTQTMLKVKKLKLRTKTPTSGIFKKRKGKLGFGKFGEISRIRSAKEMLKGL